MKKVCALVVVLAVAVAFSAIAFAADAPAPAPAKPAAAPAAPKAPAPEGVKAVVKGKISSKTAKDREGKDRKVFEIAVTEAKGADGKAIADLKGTTIRLGARDKAEEVAKFDGKDAEVTGLLGEGRRPGSGKFLRVESIK